jgi:hypothetical protein
MRPFIAIDPGTTHSAWVVYDGQIVLDHGKSENTDMRDMLAFVGDPGLLNTLVLERVESMGMAVGKEVFETVFWSGRFAEVWSTVVQGTFERIARRDVKLHLCGSSRAKDANVRQAILDRFGGAEAIGTKKKPGPLYGIKTDRWAALAVAITWAETHGERKAA